MSLLCVFFTYDDPGPVLPRGPGPVYDGPGPPDPGPARPRGPGFSLDSGHNLPHRHKSVNRLLLRVWSPIFCPPNLRLNC